MAPAVTRQPEGPSSPGGTSARSDGAPAARIATEEVELRRLAVVVDSSADAILSKDRDCRITSWNRGAERLYGYAASEIVGQNVSVLVPADHSGEEHAILERRIPRVADGPLRSARRFRTSLGGSTKARHRSC